MVKITSELAKFLNGDEKYKNKTQDELIEIAKNLIKNDDEVYAAHYALQEFGITISDFVELPESIKEKIIKESKYEKQKNEI